MTDDAARATNTTGPTGGSTVLLVEDDRGLRESLAMVLRFHELSVIEADSADEAAALISDHQPDLVILDVNLPGRDGLALLQDLRATGDSRQVLLLTARHEVADRVLGLDAGADDYLSKPFALDELLARVRVMLRRAAESQPSTSPDVSAAATPGLGVGGVRIDASARRVTIDGGEVELTKLEFDLLALLVEHADQVLTRDVIYERVWGYEADFASNTLEVVVSSLRRKLEQDGGQRVVHTVRGVGYVARVPNSP